MCIARDPWLLEALSKRFIRQDQRTDKTGSGNTTQDKDQRRTRQDNLKITERQLQDKTTTGQDKTSQDKTGQEKKTRQESRQEDETITCR